MEAASLIHAAVARRGGELLSLLERLVTIESHASQPEGVRSVARSVASELALAGFAVEWVTPPRLAPEDAWVAKIMLPELDYGEIAEAVVGRRPSVNSGSVLLVADLDTSFTMGSLGTFPFRVENGLAFGPGVADMKGGLVVLTAALRALADSGLAAPSITVVLSPDEQAGSLRSRSVIETAAAESDWCLCVECARDGGNLMGARAQCGVALLEVTGREAHAGSARSSGVSAISAMAGKVLDIEKLADPALQSFVTVGLIEGGRRRSVVPGRCAAIIDVRAADAVAWAELASRLAAIAMREDLPGSFGTLRARAHRPAVAWTDSTENLIGVAREAGLALQLPFDVMRSGAGGSSAFAGGLAVPTLDGMGPVGGGLMTDREHVDVASISERACLLALTLHLLTLLTTPARSV